MLQGSWCSRSEMFVDVDNVETYSRSILLMLPSYAIFYNIQNVTLGVVIFYMLWT